MNLSSANYPVQMGDVTEEDLRAYDGSDPNKPLLMAIKGQIYDVSRSAFIYAILANGVGKDHQHGKEHAFDWNRPVCAVAGRDASRALALMSFDLKTSLGTSKVWVNRKVEVLQDWEYKFMEKYVKVGQLV
ncbi:hypothetical protein DH2020_006327 [Rehmannia glutinosa]|uniref:Cytochrome b5 heme-binding domain-containing protein n=1 Tax=Rehmannia glutinosa TaxID=99300 RepID=A0ABR0XJ41_REHGL